MFCTEIEQFWCHVRPKWLRWRPFWHPVLPNPPPLTMQLHNNQLGMSQLPPCFCRDEVRLCNPTTSRVCTMPRLFLFHWYSSFCPQSLLIVWYTTINWQWVGAGSQFWHEKVSSRPQFNSHTNNKMEWDYDDNEQEVCVAMGWRSKQKLREEESWNATFCQEAAQQSTGKIM